ncbi:ankyrin repeat domain-containing protein [Magnetospirillum sp. ME-1]|uniref:ankyrin repeat domain-containing protein n=1 Tax=Magnetospirillum sp. ME-1 TaxID=1639348 RepID=UPI00143DE45F|nr:ankyrin repeat domain-containing protein [Magnetospirillum sp. ME-1]
MSMDRKHAAALHTAIRAKDPEAVARLLKDGVPPDAWDIRSGDNLPIHVAASIGGDTGIRILEALIDAGADIDALNEEALTPLHIAVQRNRKDDWASARLLVRRGAQAGLVEKGCACHPLNAPEHALTEGHGTAVLAMLQEGLDPRIHGASGSLLWYAAYDDPKIVATLLAQGVHPAEGMEIQRLPTRRRQAQGMGLVEPRAESPLARAAEQLEAVGTDLIAIHPAYHCFRLLVEAGADPDAAEGPDGTTAWERLGAAAPKIRDLLRTRKSPIASYRHSPLEERALLLRSDANASRESIAAHLAEWEAALEGEAPLPWPMAAILRSEALPDDLLPSAANLAIRALAQRHPQYDGAMGTDAILLMIPPERWPVIACAGSAAFRDAISARLDADLKEALFLWTNAASTKGLEEEQAKRQKSHLHRLMETSRAILRAAGSRKAETGEQPIRVGLAAALSAIAREWLARADLTAGEELEVLSDFDLAGIPAPKSGRSA